MEGGTSKAFADCSIGFWSSSSLNPSYISELSGILRDNGAQICEPRRDGSLEIEKLTHIVSNTSDFPQYLESQAFMIPVVTTQWITQTALRGKIMACRPFSPDPRMIFAEVVVTCADLPDMDKESILGACMALGGQESKDVSKLTTHICALSMDHPKVQTARSKSWWKGKIVLPHWFDDCFKLGKRVDEKPYLLPDPEVFSKSAQDDLDIPVNENLAGATSPNPQWLPPLPPDEESVRKPATVFLDKMVMLSSDLNVTARLCKAIQDIIVQGGGQLVNDVGDCDIFICQFRDGQDYVRAAQNCKDVGNLSWLYSLIVTNEWSSPLRRLLHYPIPRLGIEGFQNMRITVSNYGGESRIYLENLIKACGAEFTRTMKPDNTHLITARNSSEKCKTAPEWGITVVNHLWIEESYAKCECKPVNIPNYNHFPPRTNLGEVIGTSFLDESSLRETFYPGGEGRMSPRAKRKRKILEAAEDNTNSFGPAAGLAIHAKTKKGEENDTNGISTSLKDSKRSSNKTPVEVATPVRSGPKRFDKENQTPSELSTGGRSAKAKALDRLQHIAPDIALYEKEKKRHSKGGAVPWGGKRAANTTDKERVASKTTASPGVDDDEIEEAKRSAKKSRPSLPDVDLRIILTGFNKWVGDKTREAQDRKKLRDMGIQIVQEGHPCDYLVAPHIVRTVKFLLALTRGPTVLSSSFVDKALELGNIPETQEHILHDDEAEEQYNFDLSRSIARARSNKGRLLAEVPIYCTEKLRNGPDSYRQIAEANGALFKIYRARSAASIKPTTAEEDGYRPPEPVYLLSCDSADERQMWPRFVEMAENGHMEARIVAADWLLDVAMAQEVRFDKKYLVETWYAKATS